MYRAISRAAGLAAALALLVVLANRSAAAALVAVPVALTCGYALRAAPGARRWPAAALGVSELVTNALIHSKPPLSVRIRGTVDHPRIEVTDSSPVPPQRSGMSPEPEDVDDLNVTTFGRGLDLVGRGRAGTQHLAHGNACGQGQHRDQQNQDLFHGRPQ